MQGYILGLGQATTIPLYVYGKHKHGEVIRYTTIKGSRASLYTIKSKHTEETPCTLLVSSRTRSTGLAMTNGFHWRGQHCLYAVSRHKAK